MRNTHNGGEKEVFYWRHKHKELETQSVLNSKKEYPRMENDALKTGKTKHLPQARNRSTENAKTKHPSHAN